MEPDAPSPPEASRRVRYAPDPVHAWMDAHREDLRPHAGKHVAIDPAKGILAVGDDVGEVIDQLDALGIPRESNDVLITPVHRGLYPEDVAARAEARRVEAAALLAILVAARDTLTDFEHFASRLVQLPKGEIDDTPKPERARRLAEYHDLQRALDASTTTLRVAERLFRRLYGAGELVTAADLQPLAQDYVGAHDPAVMTFLERRPATVALLRDAAPVLRAHFGAGVTLHLDAGDAVRHFDEDELLRVTVQGHGLAHTAASEHLDAFHHAWAPAHEETARRVSFDVDWEEAMERVAPTPTVTGVR